MFYPVFLDLRKKNCLVLGGGEVALRKILSLLECEARVCVVTPEALPQIQSLAEQGKVLLKKKRYELQDLSGAHLVVSATNNSEVNRAVSEEARQRGIWVNVVDVPELCDFIIPSVLRRGKLAVAVSTEGVSPTLAKSIRMELESQIGVEYEVFLIAMDRCRNKVKELIPDENERKGFFASLVESDLIQKARMGWDSSKIQKAIEEEIAKFGKH